MVSTPSAITSILRRFAIWITDFKIFSALLFLSKCSKNAKSILIISNGNSFKIFNDEKPLPKSSIKIVKPSSFNFTTASIIWLLSCIYAVSVISNWNNSIDSSYSAKSFKIVFPNSGSYNSIRETFTDTGNKTCPFWRAITISWHTLRQITRSALEIKPFFSKTGIKVLGNTIPRVGLCQRINAS